MADQPAQSRRSTCTRAHMSPMTIFDGTCAGLRAALRNRGATHHQADRKVASWLWPTARRRHYIPVSQASKMAVRQNRYRKASRRDTRSHPPTSKAKISNPTTTHTTKISDLNPGYQHNTKRHPSTNTATQGKGKRHTTKRRPGAQPRNRANGPRECYDVENSNSRLIIPALGIG
ncbi:Hypothetical predicted protein [Pelobates cultripes]|uniref:Uncharacterized protein n=2 Tax=Pelobates cultripes TaxID=61616 RepID=A0AAD1T037_PELCU|nr:Hypothetical predicted protein [Pelobates cultripes]